MSNKSIVAPVDHKEKAPIKRSTLGWLLGLIFVVFLIGAYMSTLKTERTAQPVKEQQQEPRRGTARDVDEELQQARSQVKAPPVQAPEPEKKKPVETRKVTAASPKNEVDPAAALAERDARGVVSRMTVVDASQLAKAGHVPTEQVRPDNSAEAMMARIRAASGAPASSRPSREEAIAEQIRIQQQIASATSSQNNQVALTGEHAARTNNWLKTIGQNSSETLFPKNPTGRYVLTQGKTIPAVLLRGINTDLPCELSARTLVDVYDSRIGNALLIPKGSELIGKCSADIHAGQSRVLFAFQRLILPNGKHFDLPNAMGMDKSGASGLEANVNNHFFKMFTSSLLVALIAERAERNSTGNSGPWSSNSGGPQTAAGEVLSEVSKTILNRNKTIPPTLTVKAGERFNVNVAADMDFLEPYKDY